MWCVRTPQNTLLYWSPVKINTVTFNQWITAILSVTKTSTLLQGMDGFN